MPFLPPRRRTTPAPNTDNNGQPRTPGRETNIGSYLLGSNLRDVPGLMQTNYSIPMMNAKENFVPYVPRSDLYGLGQYMVDYSTAAKRENQNRIAPGQMSPVSSHVAPQQLSGGDPFAPGPPQGPRPVFDHTQNQIGAILAQLQNRPAGGL